MSKIAGKLLQVFNKEKKSPQRQHAVEGRLETDAAPVAPCNEDSMNANSSSDTPTTSTEMTAATVRELSDPNYNSLELVNHDRGALAVPPTPGVMAASHTTNTMNNAQQQMVMQFSNISNLHFGNSYNFNNMGVAIAAGSEKSADEVPETSKRQRPPKTFTIVAMMQSQEEPEHRMLDTISTHLGKGWKKVMRDLGYTEGQIQQAMINHQIHGDLKEVIYQLLLDWVRNADDGVATIGFITKLLWESNHRDCVQQMKIVWKNRGG